MYNNAYIIYFLVEIKKKKKISYFPFCYRNCKSNSDEIRILTAYLNFPIVIKCSHMWESTFCGDAWDRTLLPAIHSN